VSLDYSMEFCARYSGQYWAFGDYSRFVRRGAQRLESHGTGDMQHVGFEHPDETCILILTNPGPPTTVQIGVAEKTLSIQMDKKLDFHSPMAHVMLSFSGSKNY